MADSIKNTKNPNTPTPSLTPQQRMAKEREKQLTILKASNELIEDFRKSVQSRKTTNEDDKEHLLEQIDKAKTENLIAARDQYGATPDEVSSMVYKQPSEEQVRKYEEHLKKRNTTDARLRSRKLDDATVSTTSATQQQQQGERRKRVISDEQVEQLKQQKELEKRLMQETMYTDEKYEEHRKKSIEAEKVYAKEILKKEAEKAQLDKIAGSKKPETKPKTSVVDKPKVQPPQQLTIIDEMNNTTVTNGIKKAEEKEVNTTATTTTSKKKKQTKPLEYKFDLSGVPDYVQYDVIPLPSGGQCYPITSPLRCGRIPVAYLTAADENLIASPNIYRDGKIIDIILERKILGKAIKPSELCRGDRDAITMWLRATGYGNDFPIVVTNPNDTTKRYNTSVDLSTLDYLKFDLEGDEDGYFDYLLERHNGRKENIKFKILTFDEQEELRNIAFGGVKESERTRIKRLIGEIRDIIGDLDDIDPTMRENLSEDIDEIRLWADTGASEENVADDEYAKIITENMIFCTVSVNGNTDRDYIRGFIENMRSIDSYKYRTYLSDHVPGVDFNITINIPESDGGGSFSTFLRIDDAIFINV